MVDTVKLKHKLILDGILLVLLLVLTNYDLTGGLIHELLGMVMLAGILVHAFINRKYYVKIDEQSRMRNITASSTKPA